MGRRRTLSDLPGLLNRYDAGESIQSLAGAYHATEKTIRRELVAAGRRIRSAAENRDSETYRVVAFTHRLHWKRRRFTLPEEEAAMLHAIADRTGKSPEDLLLQAVRRLASEITEGNNDAD